VPLPAESSALLGRQLLGGPTPSDHLRREELAARVRQAVARLDEDDRAILLLRHFEELSNRQAAEALGVEPAAASKRYGRALLRLKATFDAGSGGSVP
jgi:RNA polymerase sigma-70 factor (ECF subfamily)